MPSTIMTGAAKRRGDAAEREATALLYDHLGVDVRRKLGAGRRDDQGDVEGLDGFTIQVASWSNITDAVRIKPVEAERQRLNAGNPYAITMIRLRGGDWRFVLTTQQACALIREVLS